MSQGQNQDIHVQARSKLAI
jgi:hypothetical protein